MIRWKDLKHKATPDQLAAAGKQIVDDFEAVEGALFADNNYYVVLEKGTERILATKVWSRPIAIHLAHCIQAQDGIGTFIQKDVYMQIGKLSKPVYSRQTLERRGWLDMPGED